MDKQKVGMLIKKKRKEKKISQKQLGVLLHVTDTTVSKWENGVNFPDIQNLKLLSSILNIPMLELLDNDDGLLCSEFLPDTDMGLCDSAFMDNAPAENADAGLCDSASTDNAPAENADAGLCGSASTDNAPAENVGAGLCDSTSAEASPDVSDVEEVCKTKVSGTERVGAELPECGLVDPNHHFRKKARGLKIAVLLLCILLLGFAAIANQMWKNANENCSYKIVDEYYGEYDITQAYDDDEAEYDEGDNSIQAYFMIAEYTGKPTFESIEQHNNDIRETYSGYFKECAMLIIYYIDRGTIYKREDVESYADYQAFLYPMPPQ